MAASGCRPMIVPFSSSGKRRPILGPFTVTSEAMNLLYPFDGLDAKSLSGLWWVASRSRKSKNDRRGRGLEGRKKDFASGVTQRRSNDSLEEGSYLRE